MRESGRGRRGAGRGGGRGGCWCGSCRGVVAVVVAVVVVVGWRRGPEQQVVEQFQSLRQAREDKFESQASMCRASRIP